MNTTYQSPVQTHRELHGRDPKPPYEWDAGLFFARPGCESGRITVRLTETEWQVIDVRFSLHDEHKVERVLTTFPLGEDFERAAKEHARDVYQATK